MLVVIVYIRVFLWWIKKNSRLAENMVVTTGDYSVEVKGVPENTVEFKWLTHFTKFFSRFGQINNIALALDSEDIGAIKKKMDHYQKQMTLSSQRIAKVKYFVWWEKLKLAWYTWLFNKKKKSFDNHLKRENYKCLGYAYITFDTELARWQCLHTFNKPVLTQMCSKGAPKYFGKKLQVRKTEEPSNILWENIGFSKFSRFLRRFLGVLITLIVLLICVGLSVFFVTFRDSFAFVPSLVSKGSIATTAGVINANFIGSLLLSITLFIITQILNFSLYYINFFEKHRFLSYHRKALMVKTAIASFLCTLVVFIPYLGDDTQVGNNWRIYTGVRDIRTTNKTEWIIPLVFTEDAGFYYTLFSMLITSNLMTIVKEGLLGLFYWVLLQYNKLQAVTQEDLNYAYSPPKYSLQYRYAGELSRIGVALAFSGMFPPALWIMTVTTFITFFIDKFNILRVYKKESYAKDLMAANAVRTLAIGYFFRFFVMWFLLAYKAIARNQYVYNGFLIMITVSFALSIAYVVLQTLFAYLNIFHCLCCNSFRNAKFITPKGQTSIREFKDMEKYESPLKPEDLPVNKRQREQELVQVKTTN